MRILGVDPGSKKTGFGVIDVDMNTGRFLLVEHGIWYLNADVALPARLADLSVELERLLIRHTPRHAVVEDVFIGPNPRSALVLGQTRGVVLVMLARAGILAESILPRDVKQLVTGFGAAQKHQVGGMVAALLQLNEHPAEDAADALAIAMAFAVQKRSAYTLISENVPPVMKRRSKQSRDKTLLALATRF